MFFIRSFEAVYNYVIEQVAALTEYIDNAIAAIPEYDDTALIESIAAITFTSRG
ncbi:unnamed protein product, partial [marine sediment metagenome]